MDKDHILVLNWNRQTIPLLRQLALTRSEQQGSAKKHSVARRDDISTAKECFWLTSKLRQHLCNLTAFERCLLHTACFTASDGCEPDSLSDQLSDEQTQHRVQQSFCICNVWQVPHCMLGSL